MQFLLYLVILSGTLGTCNLLVIAALIVISVRLYNGIFL